MKQMIALLLAAAFLGQSLAISEAQDPDRFMYRMSGGVLAVSLAQDGGVTLPPDDGGETTPPGEPEPALPGDPAATSDPFSFSNTIANKLNEYFSSEYVQITGLSASARVVVTPGVDHRICQASGCTSNWVSSSSSNSIDDGQWIQLRRRSGSAPGETVTTTLNVGQSQGTWRLTVQDYIPDPSEFSFNPIFNANGNANYESNIAWIEAIVDGPVTATLSLGYSDAYRLCSRPNQCGAWVSHGSHTRTRLLPMQPTQGIQIRKRTTGNYDYVNWASVTVLGTTATFNVRTRPI